MAFGAKSKTLQTTGSYTVEELFEKIKDVPFSAGKPTCEKYGPAFMILFPALDRRNQVQIISNAVGGKKPSQKFTIQKSDELGLGKSVVNDVMDHFTGGLTWLVGSVTGDNSKRCQELVEETYDKLAAMNL